jgi:hypothetical protein
MILKRLKNLKGCRDSDNRLNPSTYNFKEVGTSSEEEVTLLEWLIISNYRI